MTRLFDNWPKDVAFMVSRGSGRLERITYAELKADRIAKQARILENIRRPSGPVRHAAFVWTFRVEVDIPYGGWHLYLWSLGNSWWLHWEDRLAQEIVAQFPCGLLPIKENFYEWKKAFGNVYSRPGRFRRQGLVKGWLTLTAEGGQPVSFEEAK